MTIIGVILKGFRTALKGFSAALKGFTAAVKGFTAALKGFSATPGAPAAGEKQALIQRKKFFPPENSPFPPPLPPDLPRRCR
jgi:hypothetical protein